MRRLSVIIPTMNEEQSIGLVIDEVKKHVPSDMEVEILIVDTDSKDKTREIASSKGAVVIDEPRRGYGRAYKTGFEKASGEIICTLDADMTYPAERIPDLIALLDNEQLDFLTTNRFAQMESGAMSASHRLGNRLLSIVARVLFRVRVKDSQSGMWVFRKEILPKLDLTSDKMALSEEIKIEAFRKAKAREIPIRYSPRVGEVKLNTWQDGMQNLRFLFKKRFGRAE